MAQWRTLRSSEYEVRADETWIASTSDTALESSNKILSSHLRSHYAETSTSPLCLVNSLGFMREEAIWTKVEVLIEDGERGPVDTRRAYLRFRKMWNSNRRIDPVQVALSLTIEKVEQNYAQGLHSFVKMGTFASSDNIRRAIKGITP